MASRVYNAALNTIVAGYLKTATDIRARLVMTDTTCDTENDGKAKLADFTTIDASDAGGYADVALTSEVVNTDDGNDRAEFDATDVCFLAWVGMPRGLSGLLVVSVCRWHGRK